jgi:hypothetical protein
MKHIESLSSVFQLRGFDGLPLHIARRVSSPAFERIDVIDDVTRAWSSTSPRGRTGMGLLEVRFSFWATFDVTVGIVRDPKGSSRMMTADE